MEKCDGEGDRCFLSKKQTKEGFDSLRDNSSTRVTY